MVANGSNFEQPAVQNSIYNPFDNNGFMNPPQPAYNPNNAYYSYAAQQLNMQQPQLNSYYQQPQQQMRQPWQLMQPQYQMTQSPVSPFVQNSPNYNQQQIPSTYVEKGWNPTGLDYMYTEEMKKKLDELNTKYGRLNAEKARERQAMYANCGYNYYGMLNTGFRDQMLLSEFNREKAKIEAQARENIIEFNLRLSRAVHYYRGDIDIDNNEEFSKVEDIYKDTVVSVPQSVIDRYNLARSVHRGVDITERCKWEVNEIDRRVSEEYHKKIKPDATLDEFLNTAGLVLWDIEMEKHEKEARSFNDRYTYEKLNTELNKNLYLRDGYIPPQSSNAFEALQSSGLLRETPGIHMDFDTGTITLNRDEWNKHRDRVNVLANQEQQEYEAQRQMFINSVYNSNIMQ